MQANTTDVLRTQADAAVGGIRWLPIADTPEADATLAQIAPFLASERMN
jgi:hypothetical protein